VAHTANKGNAYCLLLGKLKENDHLENLKETGWEGLKYINLVLNRTGGMHS
jgi:hypothetical protein